MYDVMNMKEIFGNEASNKNSRIVRKEMMSIRS